MRRTLWGAALIGTLVLTASAAADVPAARDVSATRRFVAAESSFDRAELAHRVAITAAAQRYVQATKAHCGGDLAAAANASFTPGEHKVIKALIEEAGFDLYAVATRSIVPAERALGRALSRVSFTQLRLDVIVASIELGNRPATPGNPCADIKAPQAADFATKHRPTARLLKRISGLNAGSSTYIPRGLKPYLVTPADRAAYKTLRTLSKRQTDLSDNFTLREAGRLFRVLVG